MNRIRNTIADVLVGLVVIVVAFWMLRGVVGMVLWGVRLVLVVLVVALVLRVAGKIRG